MLEKKKVRVRVELFYSEDQYKTAKLYFTIGGTYFKCNET